MIKRKALRTIEPTAVYNREEVAEILDVHIRTLQKLPDLPWSEVTEQNPRMLGSSLITWLQGRERSAA